MIAKYPKSFISFFLLMFVFFLGTFASSLQKEENTVSVIVETSPKNMPEKTLDLENNPSNIKTTNFQKKKSIKMVPIFKNKPSIENIPVLSNEEYKIICRNIGNPKNYFLMKKECKLVKVVDGKARW